MNKTAEKFATIRNGIIITIVDAWPPHELLPNQIEISKDEFKLIGNVNSLEDAKKMISSLEKRIKAIK